MADAFFQLICVITEDLARQNNRDRVASLPASPVHRYHDGPQQAVEDRCSKYSGEIGVCRRQSVFTVTTAGHHVEFGRHNWAGEFGRWQNKYIWRLIWVPKVVA